MHFVPWLNISLSSRGLVCYYYLSKGKRNLERQKDGEDSTVKRTVYPPFDETKMHTFTIGQMDSLTRLSSYCCYGSKIVNQQETRIPGVRGHGMGHLWYRQGQLGREGRSQYDLHSHVVWNVVYQIKSDLDGFSNLL